MTTPLHRLVRLLDLEKLEENLFRGAQPDVPATQRVFGGQVAGQALVAAARTVPADRPVHSLHAYFLRPGDPSVPIVYEVDRIRDGKGFTTRRVVAIQHGRAIFNMSASFQLPESALEHQQPMPEVPDPETLPTQAEQLAPYAHEAPWYTWPRPIDIRYVGDPPRILRDKVLAGEAPQGPCSSVWMRADGTLPDDPVLHVCLVTYASDMTLLDSTLIPHGKAFGKDPLMLASLDHAMWFHQPFRADEWFLYDQDSPATKGGRGLAHGSIFTRDGRLAVTVMQEGLIRLSG